MCPRTNYTQVWNNGECSTTRNFLYCVLGQIILRFGTMVNVKSDILCYSSEWIYYFVKALELHFPEEIEGVSLENVKKCEFLRNFLEGRPEQSSVLSPSANRMEGPSR